jgi:hypothetical protein
MNLTDHIKDWFTAIDKEQQDYIAYMIMNISPLNQDKSKAKNNPGRNFISLLNSYSNYWDEVGLCLGLITTIDFVVRKFDNVDDSLDRYNELKDMKSNFEAKGLSTDFEDKMLNGAADRFANQKYAKETWDLLKENELTIEKIEKYAALKSIGDIGRI